jgi:hypothetical protein
MIRFNKIPSIFVLVLSVAFMLFGCERVRPIYQVQGKALPTPASSLSLDQVESHIVAAGKNLGWLMKPIKPGLVRGTIRRGRHSAVVRIEYDTESYDILYDSSHRLSEGIGADQTRYEGERVIHKRYNKYVKILDRQIENSLITGGS